MAVDRGNSKVAYLYSAFNPAVLRAIKRIIECGKKEGIMVGMCGEAAADPKLIPLLLAFGLDEFSVSATSVLKTRKDHRRQQHGRMQGIGRQGNGMCYRGRGTGSACTAVDAKSKQV